MRFSSEAGGARLRRWKAMSWRTSTFPMIGTGPDRFRSMENRTLEMLLPDARGKADAVSAATNIKRASMLDERFLIEGTPWSGLIDGIRLLEETGYAAWFPVTLLTVAAYGGANPTGAATARWRNAADRLRRAHLLECEEVAVELVDGDQIVASSVPDAQWLPGDVLAIRRDRELSYGCLASAAQVILDRLDLLKDLRLVLDALASLSGQETPTLDQGRSGAGACGDRLPGTRGCA